MIDAFLDGIGYGVVRLTAFGVQRLPLEESLAWGRRLGTLAYFLSARRRVAYANLKAAFPQSTPRQRKNWTKDLFRELGMSGVEIMRFPILGKEEAERLVTFHRYELLREHRQSGKGVILLTAHLGNWELSQIAEGLRGGPMTVLARKQKHRRLDGLLNSFRRSHGSVAVGKEKTGIRDLIRTLRGGGCVGVLGDQSGGEEGVWVRFFGRLTTAPRGPLALALKLDVPVLAVFSVRRQGPFHEIFVEPPLRLVRTGNLEKDTQVNMQNFIHLLESYLIRYPTQWLWGHKRWKRTRTKRITLLSDGKPGHVKQSAALVKEIIAKGNETKPPFEMPVEKIEVQFRSRWHRRVFPFFAFFWIPWVQGRLHGLRFFLTPESAAKLERTNPDLVVSAGAGLAPLNLFLGRENLAKSVVLMKPSFPFNLFRYDLALVPAHDRGILPRGGRIRMAGALSGLDPESLEISAKLLSASIRNPEKVRIGLFLGGETRNFKPSISEIESLLAQLERASGKLEGDYVVTTSRRTPESVNRFLRDQIGNYPRCQLCVIASEDPRPEVAPGMMALADFLIVTEDSLSMISEALSTGKKLVVVKWRRNGLPRKHYRFQESLQREWKVPVIETEKLFEVLGQGEILSPRGRFEEERARIQEKLETLL